jgi:hypothetical protein
MFIASDRAGLLLASSPAKEEAPVNLAAKLNVLAVFAVFAFVGAILLGAF